MTVGAVTMPEATGQAWVVENMRACRRQGPILAHDGDQHVAKSRRGVKVCGVVLGRLK